MAKTTQWGHVERALVYLTTLLLDRLSPLSGSAVLCTTFPQKLTTAHLESPQKIFHDQSPQKNGADLAGVEPATSLSPVGRASN